MKVKVGDQEVTLDAKCLEVSEDTLNDFLKDFAGNYNYYYMMWCKAQHIFQLAEDRYDVLISDRYQWFKEHEGGSDKLAEAKARVSEPIVQARRVSRDAKYVMQLLNSFLRAMDKAHENALNLGYNLRKEMDKLFPQEVKGVTRNAEVDAEVAKFFQEDN
jgi:hypothetical protein